VQPERQRLVDAIDAVDSKNAVPALARAWRAEGMSQVNMYRLFAEQLQRLAGDDPRYDVVTETMDLIWGGSWAKGHALFDKEMTDADLERP
jgi:hypothetical protein